MQRLQCGHLGAPEQVVKPAEPFVPGFFCVIGPNQMVYG